MGLFERLVRLFDPSHTVEPSVEPDTRGVRDRSEFEIQREEYRAARRAQLMASLRAATREEIDGLERVSSEAYARLQQTSPATPVDREAIDRSVIEGEFVHLVDEWADTCQRHVMAVRERGQSPNPPSGESAWDAAFIQHTKQARARLEEFCVVTGRDLEDLSRHLREKEQEMFGWLGK